jgi:hypothetical protein
LSSASEATSPPLLDEELVDVPLDGGRQGRDVVRQGLASSQALDGSRGFVEPRRHDPDCDGGFGLMVLRLVIRRLTVRMAAATGRQQGDRYEPPLPTLDE